MTNGCFQPHVNEKFVLAGKIRPFASHWASELKTKLVPSPVFIDLSTVLKAILMDRQTHLEITVFV